MIEWSEELVTLLTALKTDGLSATQIAERLGHGINRNMVIGKLYRMGGSKGTPALSKSEGKRGASGRHRGTVTRARNAREMAVSVRLGKARAQGAGTLAEALAKIKPEPKAITGSVWDALPGTSPISLLDATDATCRWPIGDPLRSGFGYCGCAVEPGRVYCAAHQARGTTSFKATASDKRKLEKTDRSRRVFA